jgi:cytochrome P450
VHASISNPCLLAKDGDGNSAAYLGRPELDEDCETVAWWTWAAHLSVLDVLEKIIDTRLAEGKHYPDVLGALLTLMTTGKLSRRNVKTMLFDILAAGTETTKITVEWAMAELLRNPGAMEAVRAEMKEALAQQRTITEADVAKLPYLQAAVKESMRLHPVAPLLLPHLVVEDGVVIGGYALPKGATVIFNSWSIMRDPAVWERPEEFVPERFLGKMELSMSGKDVKFIPLGTGRRLCPALPMVELLVPFMLASMLHALEWRLPQGMSPDQMDVTEKYTSNDILVMDVPLKVVPMVAT